VNAAIAETTVTPSIRAPIVIGMLVEPGGATTANSAGIMALRKVPTFWAIAIAAHLDAALGQQCLAMRAVLLIIYAFKYSWANMFRVGELPLLGPARQARGHQPCGRGYASLVLFSEHKIKLVPFIL
jgi:hypothetical protein